MDSILGAVGRQTTALQTREASLIDVSRVPTGRSKIDKGAKEFEAVLLGDWLQQAEQSLATVPGADDDDDAAGKDQLLGVGVQALAAAMAGSGALGIGRIISEALQRTVDKQDTASPPPNPAEAILDSKIATEAD